MTLATTTRPAVISGRLRPLRVSGASADPALAALSAQSDDLDVQARIREAIRLGTVRVRPVPGCPNLVIVLATFPDPSHV